MTWFNVLKAWTNNPDDFKEMQRNWKPKVVRNEDKDWNTITPESREKIIDGYIAHFMEEHTEDRRLPRIEDEMLPCSGPNCPKPSDFNDNDWVVSSGVNWRLYVINEPRTEAMVMLATNQGDFPLVSPSAKEWLMTELDMNHLKVERPVNTMIAARLDRFLEFA
tara:strand:- start:407 stop:898 length:492 start_codon:yes stop_codon:yes gene_type:complete